MRCVVRMRLLQGCALMRRPLRYHCYCCWPSLQHRTWTCLAFLGRFCRVSQGNFMLEAIKYPLLRRRSLHVHSLAVQILHNWTVH